MRLRATGITAKAVGRELGISEQTVKNHVASAFAKLDADNIVGALRALGWVRIPGGPVVEYIRCTFTGQCGRREGHRGQHGGFRAVARA